MWLGRPVFATGIAGSHEGETRDWNPGDPGRSPSLCAHFLLVPVTGFSLLDSCRALGDLELVGSGILGGERQGLLSPSPLSCMSRQARSYITWDTTPLTFPAWGMPSSLPCRTRPGPLPLRCWRVLTSSLLSSQPLASGEGLARTLERRELPSLKEAVVPARCCCLAPGSLEKQDQQPALGQQPGLTEEGSDSPVGQGLCLSSPELGLA